MAFEWCSCPAAHSEETRSVCCKLFTCLSAHIDAERCSFVSDGKLTAATDFIRDPIVGKKKNILPNKLTICKCSGMKY